MFTHNLDRIKLRIFIALVIISLIVIVFAMRLLNLVSMQYNDMNLYYSESRFKKPVIVERKNIFDRNGNILASNIYTHSTYVNPRIMPENRKEYVIEKMHEILNIPIESLRSKIYRDKAFVWIKRNISHEEYLALNKIEVAGIYFPESEKRFYPHGRVLSHILGMTNVDLDGISGVEKYFQNFLTNMSSDKKNNKSDISNSPEDVTRIVEDGIFANKITERFDISSMNAHTLELSIDLRLQYQLYTILSENYTLYKSKSISGIIMDISNGEILSLVNIPDFDPNNFSSKDMVNTFNYATYGNYEMGSTFKIMTFANAIENKSVHLNQIFDVSNKIVSGKYVIDDYHRYKNTITLSDAFVTSSNIATAKIAQLTGPIAQQEFLMNTNMFFQTSLEIPELTTTIFPSFANWNDRTMMSVSYGYGVSVSMLHMAEMTAAILNDGIYRQATLIKNRKKEGNRVISSNTSNIMRKLFRLTVKNGTGKRADISGYSIGGKTGSTQKLIDGKYDKNHTITSFIGAFPMIEPKYLIFILVDDPVSSSKNVTGGNVAAPIFRDVAEMIIRILSIPANKDFEDKELNEFRSNIYNRNLK